MEHGMTQTAIERLPETLGGRRLRTTTTGKPIEQPSSADNDLIFAYILLGPQAQRRMDDHALNSGFFLGEKVG
jgi:hypothetical protein